MTGENVLPQFGKPFKTKRARILTRIVLVWIFPVRLSHVTVQILLTGKRFFAVVLFARNGIGSVGALLMHFVNVPSQGFVFWIAYRTKIALVPLLQMVSLVMELHKPRSNERQIAVRKFQALDELLRMRVREMTMHRLIHRKLLFVRQSQHVHVANDAYRPILFLGIEYRK